MSPVNLPLAVFTALAWENAAVRAALQQVCQEDKRVWRGRAGQREVVVMTGGIGPRRTQQLVDQFVDAPFGAVLSVGCAGALISGLGPGQLILAPEVWMDLAETGQAERLERYPIHPPFLTQTRTAADQAGIAVAEGALFTSRQVLFTSEDKTQAGQRTAAIAVEMESGVYAAFAQRRALPFLALRVILDPVGMSLPAVKGLTTPEGDIRPLKAVSRMVTQPRSLPVLLELKRVRMRAAQTITDLCRALLPTLKAS